MISEISKEELEELITHGHFFFRSLKTEFRGVGRFEQQSPELAALGDSVRELETAYHLRCARWVRVLEGEYATRVEGFLRPSRGNITHSTPTSLGYGASQAAKSGRCP